MRNLSIREPEDNEFGPRYSSSTVSAPPFKGPRGRPLKKPRTALAYKITEQVSQVGQEQVGQEQVGQKQVGHKIGDPQIVSISTPIIAIPSRSSLRELGSAAPADHTATHNAVHKLGKSRKRTLSEEVRPTDLQTACEGCRRTIYPHGRNQGQDVIIICYNFASSATNTRSVEITHSANADISANSIAKEIERQAEEANQQHMATQLIDGRDGLESSQLPEDTDCLHRGPCWLPLMVPLQTNAQGQPAVCTKPGAIQVSPAEGREQEATSQPSNITLHMSSNSDLVEGRNQRRDVSHAIIAQESYPTEGCGRNFIPAALPPSSEDFNPLKPPEPPHIHCSEDPRIPRSALEGMTPSAENQEREAQLALIQTQTLPLQATACTAASPLANFASAVTEAHGNSDGSFNPDNFLQNLQLVKDWISTIDPNFVTQQMLGQKPALSTIPDIPVTTEGQLKVRPGCACESHRYLYGNWPTRDAELVIGSCMRHCMYCDKNIHMPGNLRKHLINTHADLNLRIRKEKRSGGTIIPGWKPLPTIQQSPIFKAPLVPRIMTTDLEYIT
ncbi:hypothetical protein V498_09550 [Pseudogymnoascus sp. VKM F-4517 (FW-2822)]|nr:hypothetical protein V498_09550 [Pseudogymnoascus sp. VKM F-4517 (FW-2822)]